MLALTCVIQSESLPRFTNARFIGGWPNPKDYEKSFRLTVLFGFMPWLNWGTSWLSSGVSSLTSNYCIKFQIASCVMKCASSSSFYGA